MTSKKEKQIAALKAREEALKFLAENPDGIAVSNTARAAPRVTRDNTFEQVKEARTAVATKPQNSNQPPVQKEQPIDKIKLSPGWRVNGSFFVHELTGCTVRGRSPPEVEGGLICFQVLPQGWRIVKNPETNSPHPYFYWNAANNQISWTFPQVEEKTSETLLELAGNTELETMNEHVGSVEQNESRATVTNEEQDVSASSAVVLQVESRPQKRSRASLFAS